MDSGTPNLWKILMRIAMACFDVRLRASVKIGYLVFSQISTRIYSPVGVLLEKSIAT